MKLIALIGYLYVKIHSKPPSKNRGCPVSVLIEDATSLGLRTAALTERKRTRWPGETRATESYSILFSILPCVLTNVSTLELSRDDADYTEKKH